MPMASMVSTVSRSDSPFFTDDEPTREGHGVGRQPLGRRLEATAGCGSSPRRTATPRSCPAAPAPSGWPGALTSTKRVGQVAAPRRCRRPPRSSMREQVRRRAHLRPSRPRSHARRRLTSTISSRRVGQVLAHVVGPDRQLAVAPVDHHRQLHRPGPAVVAEGVEGGPDGAPGEQHVVDQHDGRARSGRRGCR